MAGLGAKWSPLDGQHTATEHDIDLDLHLADVVLDDQLGVPQVLGANQACLHTQWCNARGDGGQFLVDGLQRFVARRLPREVHHVDVNRQAWQVLHERSEEHTSELQMRISYAVFCLKKKKMTTTNI